MLLFHRIKNTIRRTDPYFIPAMIHAANITNAYVISERSANFLVQLDSLKASNGLPLFHIIKFNLGMKKKTNNFSIPNKLTTDIMFIFLKF